jgi:formate dehydrogenase gamma subunit
MPLLYLLLSPKAAWQGIKLAFRWGVEDLEWVRAAPEYYYLHEERAMPPQGFLNTGQKAWWLAAIVLGPILAVTGVLLWAFEASAAAQFYQLLLFYHTVSFIIIGNMFLVHVYLAVIHPINRPWKAGPWGAMTGGKVTAEYARSHHGKWLAGSSQTGKGR